MEDFVIFMGEEPAIPMKLAISSYGCLTMQLPDLTAAAYSSLLHYLHYDTSHVMRKPVVCICENKGADQLCGNHAFVFASY